MAWGAVTLFDNHRCKLLSQRFAHGAWTCMTMSDIGVTDSHKRPCVALHNTHYHSAGQLKSTKFLALELKVFPENRVWICAQGG